MKTLGYQRVCAYGNKSESLSHQRTNGKNTTYVVPRSKWSLEKEVIIEPVRKGEAFDAYLGTSIFLKQTISTTNWYSSRGLLYLVITKGLKVIDMPRQEMGGGVGG